MSVSRHVGRASPTTRILSCHDISSTCQDDMSRLNGDDRPCEADIEQMSWHVTISRDILMTCHEKWPTDGRNDLHMAVSSCRRHRGDRAKWRDKWWHATCRDDMSATFATKPKVKQYPQLLPLTINRLYQVHPTIDLYTIANENFKNIAFVKHFKK